VSRVLTPCPCEDRLRVDQGTRAALEQIHDVGSAIHNGIFMEWQMLAPQAANQIFNLNDGTPFSWLRFWEWYSRFFGLDWEPPLAEDDPTAHWTTYSTSDDTPPVGYGKPSTCKYSFSLAEWSDVGSPVPFSRIRNSNPNVNDRGRMCETLGGRWRKYIV